MAAYALAGVLVAVGGVDGLGVAEVLRNSL